MNILLPSDVFPPKCGGAGWSAHALARALIERGHTVTALVPQRGQRGQVREDVFGVPTVRRGYSAPSIPFVLNYFRHERLWPILAADLVTLAHQTGSQRPLLIHAQHVQVAPAAVLAAEQLRIPVVVSIRDHWPWDYFATGLHANKLPYPEQSWASLATDLPARLGPIRGAAALIAIPYMQAHLRRRQAFLKRADAVVVGSTYMAKRLSSIIDPARIHTIPNMVDLAVIQQTIALPPQTPGLTGQFVLFVGKLEQNKGADLIPTIMAELIAEQQRLGSRPEWSLVIAGDGPLRPQIEEKLAALGITARFLDWVEHDEVLRLMAHCALLIYPSAWGEPLTRVLLEACACGTPMVAMPTGGTPDIITNQLNGLLAPTAAGLGKQAATILASQALRERLSAGAHIVAEQRFATHQVIGRVEALYESLGTNTTNHR